MVATQRQLRASSSADRLRDSSRFQLPDPGDVIVLMVFGWAFFCFFLLTGGKSLLRKLARLAKNQDVRDQLLSGSEEILAGLMLAGSLAIVLLVIFAYTYRYLFIGLLYYSLQFSNASFKPLHDVAFLIKYLEIAFLGGFAVLFLAKNFWRITSTTYPRILLVYVVWVCIISFTLGGKLDDVWYAATDISIMIGFALGWLYFIDDREALQRFNMTLVWAGLFIALTHATAPALSEEYLKANRFQSFGNRSTGFAVSFAPMLLALFWASLSEKRQTYRILFTGIALGGVLLLLWSGTRSAALALVVCLGMLSLVFKARIFIYIIAAAMLGLVLVIIGGSFGEIDIQIFLDRLQGSTDSGRFTLWERYYEVWLNSPVVGHSLTGLDKQFFSSQFITFLEDRGGNVIYQNPHNAYLGMAVRFGLVGMVLLLMVLLYPLRRIKAVLTSKRIPLEDRQLYILPSMMVVFACLSCLFEDSISGSGKGTVMGFVFFGGAIICERYGTMLLERYESGVRQKPKVRERPVKVTLEAQPTRPQDT